MSQMGNEKLDEDVGPKPSKMSKKDLYKPPSHEEIIQLRETELLFHSNLVKLQIEETLKEINVKKGEREKIDKFLFDLHHAVTSISANNKLCELNDLSCLESEVVYPLHRAPVKAKGSMRFLPPCAVKVVGSYQLDTCVNKPINVDLLLVIPSACLEKKDFLNQRYLRKRALYLAQVAAHLNKKDFDVQFAYFREETMKPIIIVNPSDSENPIKDCTVRIHACPEEIKLERLQPDKSNLRLKWFYGDDGETAAAEEEKLSPTPHYNSLILMDTMMEFHMQCLYESAQDFPAFNDAVKLLKVWLHQRELNQGYGSFSGFLVSMTLCYLLHIGKINKHMSSFQLVRIFFTFMGASEWDVRGVSFDRTHSLDNFRQHFPVVFLDPSGKFNLCHATPLACYQEVRREAQLSLKALDMKQCGFNTVFMESVKFASKYDHIMHIPKTWVFEKVCAKQKLAARVMDCGRNCLVSGLPELVSVMKRGLGERVSALAVRSHLYGCWSINEAPPKWHDVGRFVSIGMILDTDHYDETLEKGPPANFPEATSFREFWGEVSDLRRFKDASIREAVLWPAPTSWQRRNLPATVCKHLLKRHCDVTPGSLSFSTNQMEVFLTMERRKLKDGSTVGYSGTGDEQLVEAVDAYNDFCHKLRGLSLPLTITNIQGVSPSLRYTELFPPSACCHGNKTTCVKVNGKALLIPTPDRPCPPFTPAIEVICNMEGSGKWPQDWDALQRIKAAFYINIGDELTSKYKRQVTCFPTADYLDVFKDGLVFRARVSYHREVAILQTRSTPEGVVQLRHTPQSIELETRSKFLPLLASQLHGLYQRHNAFGDCCRLAKRWINCNLLTNHIAEEAVELVCAHAFTQPHPYTPPGTGTVGFLRFLQLLSTFDFATNPLIVDINGEMKGSDVDAAVSHFTANRAALPVMCIMTSHDRTRSRWTTRHPGKMVARRMRNLARGTLDALQLHRMEPNSQLDDFKRVFTPSLAAYDVIIHVKRDACSRCHEQLGVNPQLLKQSSAAKRPPVVVAGEFPVVNFDPVSAYVRELETTFQELAVFFYNINGGLKIGVLWRPCAFQSKPFKISSASCVTSRDSNNDVTHDIGAIVEDMQVMGRGLVDSIELRATKWDNSVAT